MEDLDIIIKQTGMEYDKISEIYKKNNNDIIATICEIEGYKEKKTSEPVLTDTQKKIKEFREIVNKKDAIMDALIQKK